jgi:isopenicillin-N N-acyltransferase like protein
MYQLRLKGGPRERGLKHGEAFRKQIHELAEIRHGLLQKYLMDMDAYEREKLALAQIEYMKTETPELFQEFCGIADGAHITLTELAIINNYTDMRDFGNIPDTEDPGGCSTFAVSTGDRIICGQTWDMHASATPFILHLKIDEPVKKEVLTVTGGLALAGVNEFGVSVFINNMHSTEASMGIIWPALVRLMLDEKTADEAYEVLIKDLPCSGHNYLICDRSQVINVETTGLRHEVTARLRAQVPGSTFHTNHYVGKLAETEKMGRQSSTTRARYQALEAYFAKEKPESLTIEKLQEDILGGGETPAVCLKRPTDDPHGPMTCGGVIVDLGNNVGEMYAGEYVDGDRVGMKI